MRTNFLLSFIIGGLILLTSHTAAVQFGFGEVDYSENESTGRARVVLTKLDENTEPVSITVSSMTFDDFFDSGRTLSSEFNNPSTRASYDPSSSGKRDFEKVAITITFPPSGGIQEQEVFIPLVDDSINEASEEFVVLAELGGNTSRESNDDISFIRGGVAVVIIVDDDPIKVGFEQAEYSVSEDDGTVNNTVYITKGDTESEVEISVVVENYINGVAKEGADYNFNDPIILVFRPEDDRLPIPVTLLQDGIAEDKEQFQLFLALNEPIRGQSTGLSTTNIVIEDDDIAVVNFTQPEYVVNEGDGSVEVCVQIAVPEEVDIFLFGTISLDEEDAEVGEDFNNINEFFDLYNGKTKHCFEVPIIDDPDREPNETLVLQLQPDTSFLPPNVQFGMTNVTITIVDNDQPEVVLIDECTLNTHNCSQYAECVDTVDGYQCNCFPGFTGDGHTCFDINECCEELHDCDSNAKCQNTIGSYSCTCKPGFIGDGRTCRDIDECADSQANTCSSNAHCFNVPGQHFCVCKAGFTGDGKECTQIETPQIAQEPAECSAATQAKDCHSRATCQSGPNGFQCVCKDGFSGDGRTSCQDIDECEGTTSVCSGVGKCRNRFGSFTCTCPRGYKRASENRCVDVDECALSFLNRCRSGTRCINTPGSYTCSAIGRNPPLSSPQEDSSSSRTSRHHTSTHHTTPRNRFRQTTRRRGKRDLV